MIVNSISLVLTTDLINLTFSAECLYFGKRCANIRENIRSRTCVSHAFRQRNLWARIMRQTASVAEVRARCDFTHRHTRRHSRLVFLRVRAPIKHTRGGLCACVHSALYAVINIVILSKQRTRRYVFLRHLLT